MKTMAVGLAVAMVLVGIGTNPVNAAKKTKISKKKLELKVGQTKKLSVKNLTKKQKKKLKWKSSKKKVASVNKKGKVKAKKVGKTTITAKVGKKKFTCKVTVKAKKPNNNTSDTTTKEQLAAEDRANLIKLIAQQRAAGARIEEDINSTTYYRWNEDGRLVWLMLGEDEGSDMGVTGNVDVSAFTALETLYIDGNKGVTGVNVKGISTLKVLWVEQTSITSLDVSQNPALERLSARNTPMTSLDVSKNLMLKELTCDGVGLTSLYIRNLKNLEYINASENKLSSIDLSQNTKWDRVYLHENLLTTIDVSGLKADEVTLLCDDTVNVIGDSGNIKRENGF